MHIHVQCPENVSLATRNGLHPVSRSSTSVLQRDNDALVPQASCAEWRHLTYLQVTRPPHIEAYEMGSVDLERLDNDNWLLACMRLTERVERCPPHGALLDLGICTSSEARAALAGLAMRLAAAGLSTRVGIAPSLALAQLALLRAPMSEAFAIVTPADAPTFLSRVPVAALPQLHPQGVVTSEVVERLRRYGLHTLGHVARIGEPALLSQFGPTAGAALAALAIGRDSRPLLPTPPLERLHFRLRFPGAPATPQRTLLALPSFVTPVAAHLRLTGHRVQELHLTMRWESGACEQVRHTLRDHTDDARLLTDAVRRLLLPLLQRADTRSPGQLLDELRLTLLDFAPAVPEQATFWRTDRQRVAVLKQVAETLSRRHGRPLMLRPHLFTPDAVFGEDRHQMIAFESGNVFGTLGTLDGTPAASKRKRLVSASVSASASDSWDGWQDVPIHLHWW